MVTLNKPTWNEVSAYTWGELSNYKWIDFHLASFEAHAEFNVQGARLERSGEILNETQTELHPQGVRVEFSQITMETVTEMDVSTVVSERDYRTDMLSYLPLYERKSDVFGNIMDAYDGDYKLLEQQLGVSERNLFVDTAIESLTIYERDLGITANNELDYEQRRQQILSRFRAGLEQTTEESIKNVAIAFDNGEIDINKTDTPGVYNIRFIGIGIPDNLAGFMQVIDIIMPAHLEVTYEFTFNTWSMVDDITWGEASGMTWNELREVRE